MGRAQGVVVACVAAALTACSGPGSTAPSAPPPAPAATAAAVTLTPNSWDLPAGGGSVEITIATSANAAGSVIAPNIAVRLQASSGSLSDLEPRTDNTGHARVTWTGTSSAIVTATAGDVQGTATIRVPAAAPTPPPPTPGPAPNPSPSPSPSPAPPSAGPLFVEITASPRLADEATPVTFSATAHGASGTAEPTGLSYAWDFTEDGVVDSTSATPTYQFRARDHWTVTVLVRSADRREGMSSIEIVVGAIPAPTVSVTLAGTPSTIEVNQTVTFTANASPNVQAGPVTSYAWIFGDGATATTSTPSTTHPFTTIGSFTAQVTASTANGTTGTATVPIRVTDLALVVGVTVSGTQTAPAALTFTATLSSAGGVPTSNVKYDWDFNNDNTTDLTQTGGSSQSAASSFNTPGTYKVKVTVTAPDGRTATNTLTIVVN